MKRKNIEIGKDVLLGKNVKIEDNVQILGQCSIGDDCILRSGTRLEDVVLGAECIVENSRIEKSQFGKSCKIGPYANVRQNCIVADDVKVGAFVELKNSYISCGCKMAHLSYIGDAELGENVNVGCGVVFANYDGKKKQRSKIGNNVFIGCNVNIVAPVTVADDTYICAGTTVTKDTEKGDFVIGRVRQENKKR
ncbi:MAG: hypothetical protein J6K39_03445 [Clostridia bacterium]|nr:hypothetical protein [Clostridia bacterium]